VSAHLRNSLIAYGGVAAALLIGWQIGNGSLWLAALLCGIAALMALGRLSPISPDVLIAGVVLACYLVGNRGFAQLSLPGIPLLPAEFVLGLGVPWLIFRAARTKAFPVRRDSLNLAIVAFIVIGAVRMPGDLRQFGVMALRDFATVYYAVFFFLAQQWCEDEEAAWWIESCLDVGLALALPAFAAFTFWPDFIIGHLSVNGIPLIYAKSDVACVFMVTASFWFLDRYARTSRIRHLVLAVANLAGVVLSDSRAAVVGLAVCAAWLCLFRFAFKSGRVLRLLAILSAAGLLALGGDALLPRKPGETSHLFRVYESARTVFDFSGTYVPESEMLVDKAGNNSFRTVWWKAVAEETYDNGLWLGLGFGHDLAEKFVEIYYPDGSEEFSVRSPHNVLLTIFARMGLVGLASALVFLAALAARTWRAASLSPDHEIDPAWMGCWAIFVTACFGVVLEGPMGAVVFWILLGYANARLHSLEARSRADSEPAAAEPAAGERLLARA
jgi:O-antigen ligase